MGMKDSLKKLGDDYGLTPEGVRHAIEAYQDIICEITGGKLSKLTYDADFVLETAEEYYRGKFCETGKWERHYSRPGVYADLHWWCSCCGEPTRYNDAGLFYRHCPHCGAELEPCSDD